MEDLLSLLVIIFTVVGMVSKSKQKKAKKAAERTIYVDIPSAPKPEPAAAPERTMMPPRPVYRQVTLEEALAAEAELETQRMRSTEGRTDHSAHISCEGHDPCHEDQLRPASQPVRIAAQEPVTMLADERPGSLASEFSGDELVRAFVMKEILTRPCERRSRAM